MFVTKFGVLALIAAGAQSASAISLSSKCQTTLAGLVVSSEASCLNAGSLVGLVVAGKNTSLVSPINTWLTGLCSRGACTNETLANVVSNVTAGCQSDLEEYNITATSAQLTALAQEYYPTARKVACLADTSNNNKTLCVTETLTNVQPYTGTITTSNVGDLVSQIAAGDYPNVPSNVTCTNCTKAAFDVVHGAFPSLFDDSVNSTITGQCGASFIDGAEPSSITETASTAIASNSSSGALAAVPAGAVLGVALASLVTVFSAFAVVA
ncbi:hypothetical protein WOLCODRAFT_26285 [Wolfiporia cocos MD-104 SS10]|uniref:Uncharacterized protein n=1 Tax=Wolfiporia cocos (strain MD-104) TaxID=742152 RepID=A0A2H3K1B6_WOLCO|nr:hypothetical protein WOLCODRAFT_26285 [Wolfiporia cocos MD-104 SS10]